MILAVDLKLHYVNKAFLSSYCTANPAVLVTNGQVIGAYNQTLNSVATLICSYGYVQSQSGSATCIAGTATTGSWSLTNPLSCSSKRLLLILTGIGVVCRGV